MGKKSKRLTKRSPPEGSLDAVRRAVSEAAERDPRTHPWGFCFFDNIRMYQWYDTPGAMFRGVRETTVQLTYPDDEPGEPKWSEILAPAIADCELSEKNRRHINKLMPDQMGIEWWGHFGELLACKSSDAKEIVTAFRKDRSECEEEEPARPSGVVGANETEHLIAFLRITG